MSTMENARSNEGSAVSGPAADIEKSQALHMDNGDVALENLGLEPQMKKNVGPFEILSVGFVISNSWVGLAATLVVGIEQGGTVTVLYGMIVTLVALGCSACTMAELSSVYPTAGGPYHWTSILAPKRAHDVLSYSCAACNIFGWLAICSSVTIQPGQFIEAMRIAYDPRLEPDVWQFFLFFQATNVVVLAYNIFLQVRTAWIHDVGCTYPSPDYSIPVLTVAVVLTLTSFVVITITCLARTPYFASSEFVWTNFVNNSGWSSNGVVFLTGLANPNFLYAGLDGAVHLAEEVTDAARTVPRALFSTIIIGFITAFTFAIAMLYSMTDLKEVIKSPTGVPIYAIWIQATRSRVAATVFLVALLLIALTALNACVQSASRLTWAFARDNALVASQALGNVHHRLEVPVWALVANAVVIFIIGCIYLGSTTAFHAFVGSALLLQQCSYAIPAALLLWHGRSDRVLPKRRPVNLGIFGWVANIITLLFAPLITVMYCFPTVLPATGSTMNYTAAVLGVMAVFSVLNWFLHARGKYQGPRLPQM